MSRSGSRSVRSRNIANFLGLPTRIVVMALMVVVVVFPFYWLVSSAFKTPDEYFSKPPLIVPHALTVKNFIDIVAQYDGLPAFINSVKIAVFTMAFTIITGSMAAYSIVNGALPRRVKSVMTVLFVLQKMYPAIVIAVPVYTIMSRLHLLDTITSLVIMNTSFQVPLAILLLVGFYSEAPFEVEEQAMLDGCGFPQRYLLVTTPMVKAGLVAVGMLTFIQAWNEFPFAVILSMLHAKPLTVVITGFITDKSLVWGPMAAMGCTVVLPVLVLMWVLQRDFVRGIAAGALKA